MSESVSTTEDKNKKVNKNNNKKVISMVNRDVLGKGTRVLNQTAQD